MNASADKGRSNAEATGLQRFSVLIVGASSGVGEAMAERLAGDGVGYLLLHGRSAERLNAVAAKARRLGAGKVDCIVGDVRGWLEEGEPESDLPPVDRVVWSAGVCDLAPAAYLKEAALREMLEINLMVPLLVLGRWFRKRFLARGARVVLLGSQAASGAGPGFAAYAAGKGGLSASARVLAAEFARRDIAVHCVEPGTLETPMTQRLREAYAFDPAKAGPVSTLSTLVEEIAVLLGD